MTAATLRRLYLAFFEERGHARIPAASLVPDGGARSSFVLDGPYSTTPP
jgi:alanyl-tRNA synthetase